MPAATPERFIVWQNGAPMCLGRVQNAAGSDITQASVSAVTRSIYSIENGVETLVHGPTTLTIANCVSDTLLQTHGWDLTRDPAGFNFYDEPPGSAFSQADTEYAVDYKITPTVGANALRERYTGRTQRFSS